MRQQSSAIFVQRGSSFLLLGAEYPWNCNAIHDMELQRQLFINDVTV